MCITEQQAFIGFLDKRTADIQETIVQMTEEHRCDEANFEKIRANIFQVIKTILLAYQKNPKTRPEQKTLMDGRLNLFADTWKASLAKAEEYHDELRVLQEKVKLEALGEIRQKFEQLWEVPV